MGNWFRPRAPRLLPLMQIIAKHMTKRLLRTLHELRSSRSQYMLGRASRWVLRAPHHRRAFHYASPEFHAALMPAVGAVDTDSLRAAAVAALNSTDADLWHAEPITSLLNGKALSAGERVDTLDACGRVNGSQLLATAEEMAALTDHACSFAPGPADLREAVRAAEAVMLSKHAGVLIANQTRDFGKQDGVTEIEEALQANVVEQRLNDQLLAAEAAGRVVVPRRAVLVPCVSNFSHFLDMCRKSLRSIEAGVPVIVLSRLHTSQYPYRWARTLVGELAAQGVDPRYLTFCSAGLEAQQALIRATVGAAAADPAHADAPPTPFLFTGARGLAAAIKADVCDGVIASTQGPNLMVALGLPPPIATAAALSATIENSGQCTAMRVLVAPAADVTEAAVERMFDDTPTGGDAASYLADGVFAGLLETPPGGAADGAAVPDGYTGHPRCRVAYRLRTGLPDPPGAAAGEPVLDEHWRKVVVDVVAPPTSTAGGATGGLTEGFLDEVGAWLVKHQPISLAINGATGDAEHSASTAPAHYHAACRLFERSALCVYSVGDADKPALTAQARPQDGETFGELPPASVMTDVTRFPMLAPAAQAAYWAYHPRAHLAARGADGAAALASYDAADAAAVGALVEAAASPVTKGYLLELADYLRTAATGPKRTHGARTCLYGLQRPPMDGTLTALRCTEITSLDELLPFLLPFALTNAAPQALLSVDPANDGLLDELPRLQLAVPGVPPR